MVLVIIYIFLSLWQQPLVFLFLEPLGSSILHTASEVLHCLKWAFAYSLGLDP